MADRILGSTYRMDSWKLIFVLFMLFGWLQQGLPIRLDHLPALSGGIQPLDTETCRTEDIYPRLESLPSEAASFYR